MRLDVLLLVTLGCAALPLPAFAQTALPQLPPSQSAPPPPPPPPSPPAPPPMVDATEAPPGVTTVYTPVTPPPPPYEAPPPSPPCGGPGAYEHDGFYLRVGSGFGGLGFSGTGPAGHVKLSGLSSNSTFAIGGTPSRGFVVGGALSGSSISNADLTGAGSLAIGDWDGTAGSLSVFVDWFPNEHRGWHVGGMLGVGVVDFQNHAASLHWTGGSIGGQAFGGYDFWLGPEWSLGIQANLGFVGRADMKDDSQNETGYSIGAFSGGLQATLLYH